MSTTRRALGIAMVLVGVGGAPARAASAGANAVCRKLEANALADAVLLRWPRVVVEGLRFPSSNRIDLGPTVGDNLQARVGVVYSPLDAYRGTLVQQLGDAQCDERETAIELEEALARAVDAPRLTALRAQRTYLDERRNDWSAVLGKASERFAARAITLMELHELRRLTAIVERKAAEVRGELARLEARGATTVAPLESLASAFEDRAVAADGAAARLRALDGWGFKITGGVIPFPGRSADWYGLAEVSYALGDHARRRALQEGLAARAEEVRSAPYELPARVARARAEARAALDEARRRLAEVDAELTESLASARVVEQADAPGAAYARDTLALERVAIESDRIFLRAYSEALTTTLGGPNGS